MIRFENVSKWYGRQKALNSVSMEIPEGETSILLGPSGCGKSTTLRLINKLIIPDEGAIFVNGQDIRVMNSENLRRSMGYVIQSIALLPHMTVEENISLVPDLLKWTAEKKRNRSRELLEMVGLSPERYGRKYPHQLSGGEAQRIGVARALAADPPFLLMDEPFGAVDPLNRESLQKEFISIQRQLRKTVVFVTHDLEEAVRLGDRITVLKEGVIQQSGTPSEILGHPKNDFIREFVGSDRILKLLNYYTAGNFLSPRSSEDSRLVSKYRISGTDSLKTALSLMLETGTERLPVSGSGAQTEGFIERRTIEELSRQDGWIL